MRVQTIIDAEPERVAAAFVDPDQLSRFWLFEASGPLQPGGEVTWRFLAPGAEAQVRGVEVSPRRVEWEWDGRPVVVTTEARPGGTLVTVEAPTPDDVGEALDFQEGFVLVLGDLKVMLETGTSPGLVAAKATLITESLPGGTCG